MTSSVKYNESKFSKSATANKTALSTGRIKITDIIDGGLNQTSNTTLKRKADDIADVLEDEVRNWLTSSSSNPPQDPMEVPARQAGKPQLFGNSSLDIVSGEIEQRPLKKAKKFVERLGYAAIGGAAVGATLFSVLVATAPDFL